MAWNKEKFKKEAKSISLIILLVFSFRSIFFEPFKIPSGSMIPTLLIGDFILVSKFAYGFKVPFSDMFGDPIYITTPKKPKAGDVIVFKFPENPDINFIKRVVAVPGDTVEVVDKIVYVNGKATETKEIDGNVIMQDMDERYKNFSFQFLETKTGEKTHLSQLHKDSLYNLDMEKKEVPENMYFVMGDNRDWSKDSREWGFVPFGHIKGEAILVWFSLSIAFPWSEDEQETFRFRPWRIGKMIN
jgi:signal peptidase I